MNKEQLIAKISEKSGLKKTEASKALVAFEESITEAVTAGEKVQLIGFGTFSVRERAARTARNPRTGEAIQVAASKQPTFKAGSKLRAAANVEKKAKKTTKAAAKKTTAKKTTTKSKK
ncbi:MAG: HU family DNA-binding protein [Clostridia bacterium]|nr:HU family DNA-binding protein [Clostridia bacterium]MBR1686855.1 HU family DNA-binding protein [Clostridia bacterium]